MSIVYDPHVWNQILSVTTERNAIKVLKIFTTFLNLEVVVNDYSVKIYFITYCVTVLLYLIWSYVTISILIKNFLYSLYKYLYHGAQTIMWYIVVKMEVDRVCGVKNGSETYKKRTQVKMELSVG